MSRRRITLRPHPKHQSNTNRRASTLATWLSMNTLLYSVATPKSAKAHPRRSVGVQRTVSRTPASIRPKPPNRLPNAPIHSFYGSPVPSGRLACWPRVCTRRRNCSKRQKKPKPFKRHANYRPKTRRFKWPLPKSERKRQSKLSNRNRDGVDVCDVSFPCDRVMRKQTTSCSSVPPCIGMVYWNRPTERHGI